MLLLIYLDADLSKLSAELYDFDIIKLKKKLSRLSIQSITMKRSYTVFLLEKNRALH